MMKYPKTLTLNKQLGKTPLETLDAFRTDNPQYKQAKMAYAGRLDPMAEGKLLVLLGDECKQREKYLNLDKEYLFEILLDASSDTHDILGLVDPYQGKSNTNVADIQRVIGQLQGSLSLPYPVFSSKTVMGKPLFLWALENKISEIDIPHKDVEVYKLVHLKTQKVPSNVLHKDIQTKISRVTQVTSESKALGQDFRRKEVLQSWTEYFDTQTTEDEHIILQLRCICSSGTYMRSLASIIGKELGSSGLAWSIKRTKIGRYKICMGRWGIWTKTY